MIALAKRKNCDKNTFLQDTVKVMKREVGIAPSVPESLGRCKETQKAIDESIRQTE